MNLNELHKKAFDGDIRSEKQLFHHLKLSFRLFLQHRVVNPDDLEDIIQETLVIIAMKYRQTIIESSFPAWANAILYNKLGDYYRAKKSPKGQTHASFEDCEFYANDEPDSMILTQLLNCLKKINKVNTNHARILNLHHLGYSTKEICEKFSWTHNNFYIRLFNARNMLQNCLNNGGVL
jgi:RNA polymerase sigma factor (sigma-70 family)